MSSRFQLKRGLWPISFVALVLIARSSSGQVSGARESKCIENDTQQFLRDGQYDEAIAAIRKQLLTCAPSSLLYQRLGFAYYDSGRLDEAVQALTIAREWRSAELHLLLAQQAHRTGRHQEELREAQEALISTPDNGDALLLVGRSFEELGDNPGAERAYNQSITLDAGNSQAFLRLGSLYLKIGDYRKAAQNLQEAAELDGKNAEVWRQLGRTYRLLGQDKKAQTALREASHLALTAGDQTVR